MENRKFDIDMIARFIRNLIKLTEHNEIQWDISRPGYNYDLLSQRSLCIRLTTKFYNKQFSLISQNNKFNFEVVFKDIADIAEELPLVNDDKIQELLKELYTLITYKPEIYEEFYKLFDKVHFDAGIYK